MQNSSPGLIDILRSVLVRLDEDAPNGANDPALLSFKRRILRSIAELELQRKSLQPPDVVVPQHETSSAPAQEPSAPTPPLPPDSVVLLVAPRTRKTRKNGGDKSSAA